MATLHDIEQFIITKSEQGEEWKEIKGTGGNYFISSYGRVISGKAEKPFIRSPWIETNVYFRVSMYINGKEEKPYIHHLVA